MTYKRNGDIDDCVHPSPPQDLFCQLGKLNYNPEKKRFLGKTTKRWRRDLSFYSIIWAALVFGLPRLHQSYSVLGSSPRLSFRPVPADENSNLIWYKATDPNGYKYWVDQLVDFVSAYKRQNLTAISSQNIVSCDFKYPPPPGKFCDVDIHLFEPCIEENRFSYHKSSPCIFLKLDKLYGWRPEFYNDTNNLPQDMPMDVQGYIKSFTANNPAYANMVWVSCEGETPADKENIGPLSYLPYPGFPGYFYPYDNVEGYLSPLVAIHLERPKTGIIINIECRAWARNIVYDRKEQLGIVHFEVMID